MRLQWLPHHKIDKTKWNNCLQHANFQNVYVQSWYLDAATPHWQAIVAIDQDDNYQAVMPLPVKQYGCWRKVYTPFFTQQLGIFALPHTPIVWQDWLDIVQQKYFAIALQTHYQNWNLPPMANFKIKPRYTYHLDLAPRYEVLLQGYRRDRKKDLKRANSQPLQIQEEKDILPLIQLFQREKQTVVFKPEHANALQRIYNACADEKKSLLLYAYQEQQRVAGAFFVVFENTLTYLFAISNQAGRKVGAATALLDAVIQRYAQMPYVLDFEGGNIGNLGDYFASFGAKSVSFPYIYQPFHKAKWFKIALTTLLKK